MKKVLFSLFAVLLPLLLCTGCWEITEPEEIGVASILGITLNEEDQYEIIAQDETLIPGSQQIQKSNWTFDIHKSSGSTISDAMQNLSQSDPERLYLAHLKAIVISEELAGKQGVKQITDFLARNPEIRQNTLFLVIKAGEFEKIFLPDAKINKDSGKTIEKIIESRNSNSYLLDSKIRDFLELSWEPYCTPYALGIWTDKSFIDNQAVNQSYENTSINTYNINVGDIAIFKNDIIAGWLTGNSSRGFIWVKGQVKGGNITLDYDGKLVTIKITDMKSKIKPIIENEKMMIRMDVHDDAHVGESYVGINLQDKDVIKKISQILNDQVEREIREAADASKKLSADIFGFGNYFFKHYPNRWKQIADRWDDVYPELEVDIRVNSIIKNIGLAKE